MKSDEWILIKVMEECDELSQRVSKALTFGLHEVQEGQAYSNQERIMHELADLLGILELSRERDLTLTVESERIDKKKDKVLKYLEYAKSLGVVEDESYSGGGQGEHDEIMRAIGH